MCLIIIADSARPSATEVDAAHLSNSDGIGVAYQQPADRLVTWEQGLTVEGTQALIPTLPLPFVVHFRFATHGGISRQLCHPFPVSRQVGITLQGQARELLFHNGVWNQHAQFERRAKLRGPVSDTRIMAYVLWREGQAEREGVAAQLATQAGKLALFTPEGITRYGTWSEGDGEDDTTTGCYYSNLHHCWTHADHYWGGHLWSPTGVKRQPLLPTRADPYGDHFVGYHYPAGSAGDPDEDFYTSDSVVMRCAGCSEEVMTTGDGYDCTVDGQVVCEECAVEFDVFACPMDLELTPSKE